MKVIEWLEAIPAVHKAFGALIGATLVGISIGLFITGFLGLPGVVHGELIVNRFQAAQIDTLKTVDKETIGKIDGVNKKLDRLTCLAIAQYDHTNPIACNK